MPDKQWYQEFNRRSNWQFKWGVRISVVLFVLMIFSATANVDKDTLEVMLISISVAWVVAMVVINRLSHRRSSPKSPEAQELRKHLDRVAPIPDFSPSLSEDERDKQRDSAFLNRIRAAFVYYEKQYGHPLTVKERERVERMVGIYEDDYRPGIADGIGNLLETLIENAGTHFQADIQTVEQELERTLGSKATLFTRRDKLDFALLSASERLDRYNDIKKKLAEGDEIGRVYQPEMEIPAAAEILSGDDEPDFDTEFVRELRDESRFNEYVELQRAKILVIHEADPKKRNERLKVFNQMVLRYRHDRGW